MSRSSDPRYDRPFGPDALIPFLEGREGFTFAYSGQPGTQDCARFCDAGVLAVTGVSPLAGFVSQWSSAIGAGRVLARHGGMAVAVDSVMDRIDVSLAGRGDVALLADRTLALVEGATVVGPAQTRGLFRLPRTAMIAAWTVRA